MHVATSTRTSSSIRTGVACTTAVAVREAPRTAFLLTAFLREEGGMPLPVCAVQQNSHTTRSAGRYPAKVLRVHPVVRPAHPREKRV